jgi:DNA-binding SARP family transcriptional activator
VTTHLAVLHNNTAAGEPAPPLVNLLRGPYVRLNGRRTEVPEGSKRLLAYVCLSSGPVERRRVAGALWPDGDEVRAAGNLRSALWRLKGGGIEVIDSDKAQLWLRPGTLVDVDVLCSWARRLVRDRPLPEDLELADWHAASLDLLPGMDDEWVVIEREYRRQLLLHALEALSRHLVATGDAGKAVVVASAAVAAEPLRESSQLVLIEAHLAEGNISEARRSFEVYRQLATRELGVEPGGRLRRLAHGPRAVRSLPQ